MGYRPPETMLFRNKQQRKRNINFCFVAITKRQYLEISETSRSRGFVSGYGKKMFISASPKEHATQVSIRAIGKHFSDCEHAQYLAKPAL